MRRRSLLVFLGLLTVLAVGCVERKLSIDSDPPGALVYLNDQEVGRTPLTTDFTWYGDYDVQLRKDGFQTVKTSTAVKPPVYQWVPIDLFAELMPFKLTDHQHFSYSMKPATTQPVDPNAIMGRAERMSTLLESSPYAKPPATQPATTQATP